MPFKMMENISAFLKAIRKMGVPDHYCSETMLEWDAVPNGFELLTSETFGDDTLARDFLRLLPEEGCAVDDLSGERSASALSTATLRGANGVFTLDGGDRDDEWHLRTFFRAPSDDGAARRVRVSLRTDAAAACWCDLARPPAACRRTRTSSSGGSASSAGSSGSPPSAICDSACTKSITRSGRGEMYLSM